jgi:hypothetical protein
MRLLKAIAAAAIVGASILALPIGPVSAFTLCGPSLGEQAVPTQTEKVFYRGGVYRGGGYRRGVYGYHGGYGYRRYRYGYGYGVPLVGGLAVGAAVLAPRCWIDRYGYQVCN